MIIKRFGNDEKIVCSFKKVMLKDFLLNDSDLSKLKIQRLPCKKSQISFQLKLKKQLSLIQFQRNQLFLNHNRYEINISK